MTATMQPHSAAPAADSGGPMPSHHLGDELLLAYAGGTTDEATGLMVATHLTLCPACRRRAAAMDALGGAMFEELPPAEMADDALARVMARLDAPAEPADADAGEGRDADAPAPSAPAASGTRTAPAAGRTADRANDEATPLPRVLQRYSGGGVAEIAWTPIGLGVETADLPTADGSRAFMLRVPGGRAVPQHTHEGNEYVLILQGSYTDELGHFARGDVAHGDPSIDHKPVADPGPDCVCLAVTDAPIRLSGPVSRFFNRFVKI